MSERVNTMQERISAITKEVVAYVEGISDANWARTTQWEDWSVGATARHIGRHLGIFELAALIVQGEPLPDWTMDDINAMSHEDSQAHVHCTKAEALELIRKNSAAIIAFVGGLDDADLGKKGTMPAFQGDVTAEQLIEFVVFQSAAQHFDSIKSAVGA